MEILVDLVQAPNLVDTPNLVNAPKCGWRKKAKDSKPKFYLLYWHKSVRHRRARFVFRYQYQLVEVSLLHSPSSHSP